jgi:hypothetical protein
MSYAASSMTQTVTSNIALGSNDNQIIGIQVVTTGRCNPIKITEFKLNTNGSTQPSTDITNATIWTTGTSSTFATTTFFGNYSGPNGSFSITGDYNLSEGTNYFWLTYDVPLGATEGNVVDAEVEGVVVGGGNYVPSPTTVSGNRAIGIRTIISNGTGGGNWNDPSTWQGGLVPTIYDHVRILGSDVVNMNVSGGCIDLTVESGGRLNVNSYTFTLYGNLTCNGTGQLNTNCNSELIIDDYGGKDPVVLPSMVDSIKKLTINRDSGIISYHDIDLSKCVPADSIV